ncbi:MAG: hypothetical protein R3232_10755, partial [Clostridia bacterium]|nr:hypothetical protein [Clostridia bacterium]
MKKKLIVLTVILTSVALLLAGCQKTSEPTPTPTPVPTATPAPTPEDTTITVIDSQGTETILEKAPETVVSLAPN